MGKINGLEWATIRWYPCMNCNVLVSQFQDDLFIASSPGSPQVLNVARRERREPGKIYHVRDVGVEATWSTASANRDSAPFHGNL